MAGRRSIFTGRTDNELGITRLVSSRGGTAAVGDAGRGPEVKLLGVHGDAVTGKCVSVCVSAVKSGHQLAAQGFQPGILTAILKFGNGAGIGQLEFDIPSAETHDPVSPSQHGLLFTVPAGNFELYARDDSLISPKAGMGNPSNVGGSLVTAFVAHGRMGFPSVLHKTDFFAWQPGLPDGQTSRRFAVPPFAATYILMRYPRRAMTVRLGTNAGGVVQTLDEYTIAVGENHSAQLVPPRCSWIEVVNEDGGGNAIDRGQIIYNMDFELPNAATFTFLSHDPGQREWTTDSGNPTEGFNIPITLTFNRDVLAASVVLGGSLLVSQVGAATWPPFTFNVVGPTIVIHNNVGDVWRDTLADLFITLGAGITDTSGNALSNPQVIHYEWNNTFS